MSYSDAKFSEEGHRFVLHSEVKEYLENYSKPAKDAGLYSFNTSVEEVQLISTNPPKYRLILRKEIPNSTTDEWWSEDFDAVVVGSGQFNVPFVPNIKGLPEFWAKYPEKCIHSKYFKNNVPYTNKIVAVIGCGVSGNDIVFRVRKTAKRVYQSKRNPSRWEKIPGYKFPEDVVYKPEILEITATGHAVFNDGTQTDEPIDVFVFATGYQHDYKFFRQNFENIIQDGKVTDLYLSTFSKKYPNLTFIACERMGSWAAFRAYEYQSCAIDGIYSGRAELPSLPEMQKRDDEITEFLKDVESKPFQSMLIVRQQAVDFSKLAGGFDTGDGDSGDKTKINRISKWTHELDVELLDSSFEYLVESAYEGKYPNEENTKIIHEILSFPTFSPSDDDIYN